MLEGESHTQQTGILENMLPSLTEVGIAGAQQWTNEHSARQTPQRVRRGNTETGVTTKPPLEPGNSIASLPPSPLESSRHANRYTPSPLAVSQLPSVPTEGPTKPIEDNSDSRSAHAVDVNVKSFCGLNSTQRGSLISTSSIRTPISI